jgi:Peptidase M15
MMQLLRVCAAVPCFVLAATAAQACDLTVPHLCDGELDKAFVSLPRVTKARKESMTKVGVTEERVVPMRAASSSTTPEVPDPLREIGNIFTRFIESLIRPVHDAVVMQFTPQPLRDVLEQAARHFNSQVLVISAYRSPAHNKRAGGAKRSMHMVKDGKRGAVDFKVTGVNKHQLHDWLKNQPQVKGLGLYCGSDYVHIDNGRPRSWYWKCKS